MGFLPNDVKSIQRGSITLTGSGAGAVMTNTASITAVVTANCELRFGGFTCSSATANAARIALTNTTTITASAWDDATSPIVVASFEIIEYYAFFVKGNQSGTINLNGVTSNTGSVTAVTNKYNLNFLGYNFTNNGVTDAASIAAKMVLTNTTTITVNRAQLNGNITAGYNLFERY